MVEDVEAGRKMYEKGLLPGNEISQPTRYIDGPTHEGSRIQGGVVIIVGRGSRGSRPVFFLTSHSAFAADICFAQSACTDSGCIIMSIFSWAAHRFLLYHKYLDLYELLNEQQMPFNVQHTYHPSSQYFASFSRSFLSYESSRDLLPPVISSSRWPSGGSGYLEGS